MEILRRPLVTEKNTKSIESQRVYGFEVAKKANKIEIKKAVENIYGVRVIDVRTSVMPGKAKNRFTKRRIISGVKGSYKKAFVQLAEGDTIELFGE